MRRSWRCRILLELQKKSYRWFLDEGLQEVFTDVASITNYAGNP